MPKLDWIGKQAVVNHHREVPFHLLRADDDLSVGDPGSGNLLVEGDNLVALKALLPYYAGRVKCIYIDPPYNTGNEAWVYNDNSNAPEIKKWLNATVGREAEDLSRHDKWLCMMYPRLVLLREFLREDGAIFISIDDNEVAHLRCIMDEVFGARNFVDSVVWQKKVSPSNDSQWFSADHDYLVVYAASKAVWRPRRLPRTENQKGYYANPDNDPRGPWNSAAYTCAKTRLERENLYYGIVNPHTGEEVWPRENRVWAYDQAAHSRNEEEGRVWWGKDGRSRIPRLKTFLSEARDVVPRSVWPYSEVGHTQGAKQELLQVIPGADPAVVFGTPKPTALIQRILQLATDPDSLILDSFAGSGTTGHAVLAQNAEDGGNRKFILVELEPHIAQPVTRERLRRVIEGYSYQKQGGQEAQVEGLGGGFRYCTLGEPLFEATGRINPQVKYDDLARHLFFMETGEPLSSETPEGAVAGSPLFAVHGGAAYYLLYNGVLKDKRPNGGNVLTGAVLAGLPRVPGTRMVVFGTSCRLGAERLNRAGVEFRHIPYGIRVG